MDNPREPKKVLDWLGLKDEVNLLSIHWLGPIVSVIFGLFIIALLFSLPLVLVRFVQAILSAGPYANDVDGSSVRNIGLVLVAIFGAPFLVWRSVVAAKQAKTSDDSLFNEKITSFANQLAARRQISRTVLEDGRERVLTEWEDDLVARAAAIDGLEGLAIERPSASPRVVRLIANYIRGTFPCYSLEKSGDLQVREIPRMDLQKSIDVIGSLLPKAVGIDQSNWRLDLTSCHLDGVNFKRGFFRAADFSKSRLEAAVLNFGNFEGGLFYSCLLNYGSFTGANLRGVRFDYATLNWPYPGRGGFVSSINLADLRGATFISTDLSALSHLGTPKEISETFGTRDTTLSRMFRPDRPNWNDHQTAFDLRMIDDRSTLTDDQKKL